jgi:hypothetical protein
MRKWSLITIAWLVSAVGVAAHPSDVVDIYGDDSGVGKSIVKKYERSLSQLENKLFQAEIKYAHSIPEPLMHKIIAQQRALFARIQKEGGYVYVNADTVMYPDKPERYITLEVIRPQDKNRLRWTNASSSERTTDKVKQRPAAIQAMLEYDALGTDLFLKGELDLTHLDCPSYHCTFGFKHPKLKPFKPRFDALIRRDKSLIIRELSANDPTSRGAAAFLVGEFHDPKEILRLLAPHVTDVDSGVRNNVMRVIGTTMMRSNHYQIDVRPFIQLLDSTHVSDRNKALLVLFSATQLPEQNKRIRKQGLSKLQQLVKLKQPNNHDFAQKILDKWS